MALGVEEIENALGKSLPLIVLRNDAKVALKPCGVINKLS